MKRPFSSEIPRKEPGYYPGFSTMSQKENWEDATRKEVENRIAKPDSLKFFSTEEGALLEALFEVVLPQSDRQPDQKIPILALVDERLHRKKFDGYILEGTVEDDLSHRLGLTAISKLSQAVYNKPFTLLSLWEKEDLLLRIREQREIPENIFDPRLPPKHYFSLLVKDAVSAYYSHPLAWDEIGFGGPAYPRGYVRTVNGLPESWEKEEQRYEWQAPMESRSDHFENNNSYFPTSVGQPAKGAHSGKM